MRNLLLHTSLRVLLVAAFAGLPLAVTPAQVKRLKLPTAPPKKEDKRAFHGKTCQAEAIAPDELARIVREGIEERMDMDLYRRVLKREQRELRALKRLAASEG